MTGNWHAILYGAWSWDRWGATLSLGMILWVGLAILTLSLLVLMRTRWGQARPLSKCIILSLFAHALFLAYAYGTRLVLSHPPAPREQIIRLAVTAPRDPQQESSAETPAPRWRESFASQAAVPDLAPMDRQPAEVPGPQPADQAAQPEFATGPRAVAPPEPQRASEASAPVAAAIPLAAAATSPDAKPPTAQPSEVLPPPQPENTPLERIVPAAELERDTAPSIPSSPAEWMAGTSQLQRLSELASTIDAGEAVRDTQPRTQREENRDTQPDNGMPGPRESTATAPKSAASVTGGAAAVIARLPVVRRLGDSAPLPKAYRLRSVADRLPFASQLGGNAQTETAVQAALAWLAANQEVDGHWDATRHGGGEEPRVYGHDRQSAGTDADTGITGLAILALLAAGHTHLEGAYRSNVQHGLEYLIGAQQPNGSLAGKARLFAQMYCHGIATLAMSEAYAMTGDDRIQPAVQRAVQFTLAAQHPTTGGWRYQPGDVGDTSQFGWQLMALCSAELSGTFLPDRCRGGMLRFLDSVSSGTSRGLAGYRVGEKATRTMTAEALACRLFLGQVGQTQLREAVAFIMEEPPQDGQANLYYWYYATLALYQTQGEDWQRWNASLQQQLLRRQRSDGPQAGSWDTDTVWGGYGGRVYTTAMAAMCLEVYYRYLPVLAVR